MQLRRTLRKLLPIQRPLALKPHPLMLPSRQTTPGVPIPAISTLRRQLRLQILRLRLRLRLR